jgi:ribosomal protein S18 acetylase RimI-like enzyme
MAQSSSVGATADVWHGSLRPATPDDREFLFRVYASTRQEELAPLPWPPAAKESFLRQQFEAQARHYEARYRGAERAIVLRGGVAIGQLWVHRGEGELRVLDVALLPEHRRTGVGTRLLAGLLDEARACRLPVVLHVLADNRARRLYERLGFVPVGPAGVYQQMESRP